MFERFRSWSAEYGFPIGVGLSAAALGFYFALRRKSAPGSPLLKGDNPDNEPQRPIKSLPSHNSDNEMEVSNVMMDEVFDKQVQINRAIQLIEIGNEESLTYEQIRAIYLYSLDIIRDEYAKFTREVRKRRRLIRKINEEQYLSILLDYDNKISELLERGRIELVQALNIDPEVYDESIYQLQQSQYRADFFVLEQSIGRRLKEKMLRRRRLSDKTANQILKYQLSFLKTRQYERYQELLKSREEVTETQIVNAIQTIIEDLIYEKYGYEEEHMIIKISDPTFSQKEQIKLLTDQIQLENERLLGELAGFRNAMQTIDYD